MTGQGGLVRRPPLKGPEKPPKSARGEGFYATPRGQKTTLCQCAPNWCFAVFAMPANSPNNGARRAVRQSGGSVLNGAFPPEKFAGHDNNNLPKVDTQNGVESQRMQHAVKSRSARHSDISTGILCGVIVSRSRACLACSVRLPLAPRSPLFP